MYDDREEFQKAVPKVVLRPFTITIGLEGLIPMLPPKARVTEFEMDEDGGNPKISGWMDYEEWCIARRFVLYEDYDVKSERPKVYLGTLETAYVKKHLYEEFG